MARRSRGTHAALHDATHTVHTYEYAHTCLTDLDTVHRDIVAPDLRRHRRRIWPAAVEWGHRCAVLGCRRQPKAHQPPGLRRSCCLVVAPEDSGFSAGSGTCVITSSSTIASTSTSASSGIGSGSGSPAGARARRPWGILGHGCFSLCVRADSPARWLRAELRRGRGGGWVSGSELAQPLILRLR